MNRSTARAALVAALALASLGGVARSALAVNTIVLPRAGQVGIGIQAQGGTLLTGGGLGHEFGAGPGLSVRVRYRMRYERAIGLTFDTQRLKARDPSGEAGAFDSLLDAPAVVRDKLKLVNAGIEFYQMFNTRERTVKMISAGVGLVQVSAHLTNGETQFPLAGDGLYVSLGAGVERFFFKSWAWDMGTRYMSILHDGKMNHDLQLQFGMIFYAAY
jgi:hypothetical protein